MSKGTIQELIDELQAIQNSLVCKDIRIYGADGFHVKPRIEVYPLSPDVQTVQVKLLKDVNAGRE